MFCLKCGKEISNDAMQCPYCKCPTENAGSLDISAVDPSLKTGNTLGIVSSVLGGVGILGGLLIAIVGWILGIAGIILAVIGKSKNSTSKACRTGLTLSIITLVVSLINSVLGYILVLIM